MTDKQLDMSELVPENLPDPVELSVPLDEIDGVVGPVPDSTFVDSIKKNGLLYRVILVGKGDRFEVRDGVRRILAARRLGWSTIPALVYPKTSVWGDVLTLVANSQRSSNPVSELQAIQTLIAAGAKEDQIAKATGLGKSTIRKRLQLAALPPSILQGVGEGKLRTTTAEAISKLGATTQTQLAAKLAEEGKLTGDDVEAARMVEVQRGSAALSALGLEPLPQPSIWPGVVSYLRLVVATVPVEWEHTEALKAALEAASIRAAE